MSMYSSRRPFVHRLKLRSRLHIYVGIVATLFIVTLFLITKSEPFNPPIEKEYPSHYDLYLSSSYYYPRSESLGSNAVALIVTTNLNLTNKYQNLQIIGWNATHNHISNATILRISPFSTCHWIPHIIQANTLPGMHSMAVIIGDEYVKIPFYRPRVRRREVVTCVSPLFAAEQWYTAMFAIHTYKRFGSHPHIYIRSAVTPFFDLLREYEKADYLTLQPWQRMRLSSIPEYDFNPNTNVEFRNQPAAQTDCLLQYKESASFISFMDLDDIVIPRVASTFLEEYSIMFGHRPNLAYVHYAKENVKVKASRIPKKFSLARMYRSIVFDQITETGKMVVSPRHVNSTWIHWPLRIGENMTQYGIETQRNAITHLKFIGPEADSQESFDLPLYEPLSLGRNKSTKLISRVDLTAMQFDMEQMWSKPHIRHITRRLPRRTFYFNIILKCFTDTFYSRFYGRNGLPPMCPGPDVCKLPRSPGIECTNSAADFHSSPSGAHFTIHFPLNSRFRVQDGCL